MAKEQKIRDHSAEHYAFVKRVIIGFGLIIVLILVLLVTIFRLQFSNYSYFAAESKKNSIEMIIVPPKRGIIYDRNHIPLAQNEAVYQLMIVPDKVKIPTHFKDLNQELESLQSLVGLTPTEIEQFQTERKHYAVNREVPLKDNLTRDEIYRFSAQQHLYSNVSIEQIQHRSYPYGAALAHVVGYMSKINDRDVAELKQAQIFDNYQGTADIGKSGIEKYYESLLHGEIGYKKVEITSRRKIVRELESELPKSGSDIELTIDLPLQLFIYNLLKDQKAAVVAINPQNGEVLALVSTPSFDPNLFVGGISAQDYNQLRDDKNIPFYNRATLGGYSPASTVKPYMAISALNEGVITQNTVMNHPGYWQLPNSTHKFRDWRRYGHGKVNLTKSLAESVDTFYYQVAYDLGIDRIDKWMQQFGFGERTGIDLSSGEESQAILPSRDWKMGRYKQPWLPADTISVGIGQGYWTATPLQMAKALTILINEGKVYRPHLLRQQANTEPLPTENYLENTQLNQKIDAKFWQMVKKGMHEVLYGANGTAKKIFAGTSYQAAGKSGSAQVFSLKQDEVYDASKLANNLKDNALFVAYAPFDKPEIALALVLENGGSGSSVGGAIARKILDYYFLQQEQRQQQENQQVQTKAELQKEVRTM